MGMCQKSDLPFLTDKQLKEFNSIGYSGKTTDGKPSTRIDYLNSLDKKIHYDLTQLHTNSGEYTSDWFLVQIKQ